MVPQFDEAVISYVFLLLAAATGTVGLFHRSFYYANVFQPSQVFRGKRVWTLLSSALVHGSWWHLLLNIAFCLVFLTEVEYMLVDDFGRLGGRWSTAALLVATVAACNLIDGLRMRGDATAATAGLSALACAMAVFYFAYFPLDGEETPSLIFPVFKAFHIAFGVVVSFGLAACFRIGGNQFGHLVGCLVGLLAAVAIRPALVAELVSYLSAGD